MLILRAPKKVLELFDEIYYAHCIETLNDIIENGWVNKTDGGKGKMKNY